LNRRVVQKVQIVALQQLKFVAARWRRYSSFTLLTTEMQHALVGWQRRSVTQGVPRIDQPMVMPESNKIVQGPDFMIGPRIQS
jgi:hypothetical protein